MVYASYSPFTFLSSLDLRFISFFVDVVESVWPNLDLVFVFVHSGLVCL